MNTGNSFNKESAYGLYVSQEHDCSYLTGQRARTLFLDPSAKVDSHLYQLLIDRGFRRSGHYLYQPACPNCEACISFRIPVKDFTPNRSQRRNWKQNHNRFHVIAKHAEFSPEHFDLFRKYQAWRHPEGAMAYNEPEQFTRFLICDWARTIFHELRQDDQLLAVAVTDLLPDGLSSIYTFFDPERPSLGLGVFALLWQIHHAAELNKRWVYPGFWIHGSEKMNYKAQYRPFEAWSGQEWLRFTDQDSLLSHFSQKNQSRE